MDVCLYIEVAGCPTVCQHCWAQGVPYRPMPLDDIRWVLEQARSFCDERRLGFSAYPMHEVAAHPDAPEVLQLFRDVLGSDSEFEPLATTGVPIAMREEWERLIKAIGATGTTTFWVAFHGDSAGHDRLVHRAGAFEETCLAVRRIRSLGFTCGANVFVTKATLAHFEAVTETLHALGLDAMWWGPAAYYPTARSRRYEQQRPELDDLLPYADQIGTLSAFEKEKWANLMDYTEASWRRKALEGTAPGEWQVGDRATVTSLVCRSNFDVHTGKAGVYGQRHSNFKREDAQRLLERAVRAGPRSDDQLYLGATPQPTIVELAQQVSNAQGLAIYFEGWSMRYRWLDRARRRQQ